MTEKQYREGLEALTKDASGSVRNTDYLEKLDELAHSLKEMILSNTDEVTVTGQKYYVSLSGDDGLDGKTPETAWKSIERVNTYIYNIGDAVLFNRGDMWRDGIKAQSGVTYSAYGIGEKPKIYAAYDGTVGEWTQTDIPNIWRYEKVIDDKDIGVIVFNDGECYAEKQDMLSMLKKDLDFTFNKPSRFAENGDSKIYLYCKNGNPKDIFKQIDISKSGSIVDLHHTPLMHDVTVKNLELRYAQDVYFIVEGKNIRFSYCDMRWTGGHYISPDNHCRYGGGACCWQGCENIIFDHCYFYQQFDSGVTPQYDHSPYGTWKPNKESVFKDYITTDCLFEKVEYTLEYFQSQYNFPNNRYENMYFAYNICREGGYGFGDKTTGSAYIKAWQNHQNRCFGSIIEKNIFDRAASRTLDLCAIENDRTLTYEKLPKFKQNVYIDTRSKPFATVNGMDYAFNEDSRKVFEALGFEIGAVYKYL